jgi:hypothetical protein
MIIKTGNKAHDDACLTAENTRQAAMVVGVSQATAKSADIAFYRAVIASAKVNGVPPNASVIQALMDLGTGGV